ncbi:histidine kinase [Gordonia sp. CPCC 205515]|uniref:sensor histidine kinase n=1 Tax=Gordonia sp. CPCC 205515 TaxID=3140791 RepID=UPI003AF3FB50
MAGGSAVTTSWRNLMIQRAWLTDAVVALAVFVAAVIGVNLADPDGVRPDQVRLAELLVFAASASLLGARRSSTTVVAITTCATVVLGFSGYVLTPLLLAPLMVALYRFAVDHASRVAWTCAIAVAIVVVAAAVGNNFDSTVVLRTLGPALWLLLPAAIGAQARLRASYLTSVQARAETAERTRESEAQIRVTEERMRIARELHDVVAHHMTIANAQAGTALHVMDAQPEVARGLLDKLQDTTAAAIVEMREVIAVLRTTEDESDDALHPAPGLAELPALLAAADAAGLHVDLEIDGEQTDLAPGTDLTAYRIIQEALTNATKHSGTPHARLQLRYARRELTITVVNAAPRTPTSSAGFGIIGMRERAHAVGGDLRVDTHADNGFLVVASLPITRIEPT